MRKLLTVGLLAAVALGGLAACSSGTPSGSPSSSPTSAAGAPATTSATDDTKSVCDQAVSLETTNGSTALGKIQQAITKMSSGDTAGAASIQGELVQLQQSWVTAYQGFQSKNIKPEVKTAINNFITYLQSLGTNPNMTVGDATAKFQQLDQALKTACGA